MIPTCVILACAAWRARGRVLSGGLYAPWPGLHVTLERRRQAQHAFGRTREAAEERGMEVAVEDILDTKTKIMAHPQAPVGLGCGRPVCHWPNGFTCSTR